MVLQAIKYNRGRLQILDQLQLPHKEVYQILATTHEAWSAIKEMRVRGAPAIAIVAALALAVELCDTTNRTLGVEPSTKLTGDSIISSLKYLVTSRPTAVNLADAARKLEAEVNSAVQREDASSLSVKEAYIRAAEQMLIDDVRDNENIGMHGAKWIFDHCTTALAREKVSILTHCNTGSLATAGYGTALGVIRSLHAQNGLRHAYYTETRPYNQGSRLTGYELIHDGIPATLITDSMAAALLQLKGKSENIVAVVVGADRVAANGDTANKIGTYALAILARHHDVRFLVAAPRTTIDLNTPSGDAIVIEERSEHEVISVKGPPTVVDQAGCTMIDMSRVEQISTAALGTRTWNPAFDVTPAGLIDAIVTESGVVEKGKEGRFQLQQVFDGK